MASKRKNTKNTKSHRDGFLEKSGRKIQTIWTCPENATAMNFKENLKLESTRKKKMRKTTQKLERGNR